MDLKLDAGAAKRMSQQAEAEEERAFQNGFNQAMGSAEVVPGDDEFSASMAQIMRAIQQGEILPLEFKPIIDRYIDKEVAMRAKYEPRDRLMARMSGTLPPPPPNTTTDSAIPQRRTDARVTPRPAGAVRTRIPNAYQGPLQDEEPRLDPPRTMWGA
ncbi:MAG: hypothetical protein ACM3SS_02745 [Rhodospirillaceae bacterium]